MVFNTKKRQMQLYFANDQLGLQVKGSTLSNFTEASVGKTIRKPEDMLVKFMKAAKVRVDKIFSEIKSTEKVMTGRINKDCILLKAW